MKKIFKIIPLFVFVLSCKAQTPVVNIENQNGNLVQNAYYKDSNNLLNPFVGTYVYTNGTTSLKIIFQKKTMSFNGYNYEDLLIGEYQYVENGVVKINTLNDLSINFTDQSKHSIDGNSIVSFGDYSCHGCVANEKRLRVGLVELNTGNHAQIMVRNVVVNGQPAIKINVSWQVRSHNVDTEPNAPMDATFPGGDYVLIKQ